MLPPFRHLPLGEENPLVVRASAALPAAGAWDAAPVEINCGGFERIVLFVTYTRGGAGGAMDLQARYSPYAAVAAGVENWFPQSVLDVGAVAAGADTQSRVQGEYLTFQATGAGVETFVLGPLPLKAVERAQVRCRESGNAGAPGTVMIVGVLL